MTSDTQRSTSAARMRRHRQRRKAGEVVVGISLTPQFVADLVRLHWLSPDRQTDQGAVAAAFLAFATRAWAMADAVGLAADAPGGG